MHRVVNNQCKLRTQRVNVRQSHIAMTDSRTLQCTATGHQHNTNNYSFLVGFYLCPNIGPGNINLTLPLLFQAEKMNG